MPRRLRGWPVANSVFNVAGLLKVTLPTLEGTRDAKGRFTSAQGLQRQRNGEMAVRVQAAVLSQIQERIERRAASSGRLLRVTAASENAQYDTWSIGVGNVPFLDSSIAKYWRTFEQGSLGLWKHPFIGTQLMPKGSSKPPYPVAHGAVPGIRTTRAELPWMNGEHWVVKKEIAPRFAYREAGREVNLMAYGLEQAHQLVRDIIGRPLGSG